ncbi:hypothetical protein L2E82_33297 [Cichorium intybus]|uniref:Uncharacterized protein n=1 Tax=Cichorium intybus TaxID=13427 RepID=A0ACB9BJR4_CICIN|nr:hypothetical protein L2E82_33297 [Cichorium intybus]
MQQRKGQDYHKQESQVSKSKRLKSVVISKEERIREEMSYADIVRGESKDKMKVDVDGVEAEDGQSESTEEDCFEITVIPKEEDMMTIEKSLIGEVKSYELLQNIYEMPKIEGLLNVSIQYIGGLFVIMEFDSKELAEDYLVKAKPSWRNWFGDLFMWSPSFRVNRRVASISIFGVPFHVWNADVFEEIARLWGTPVRIDKDEEFNLHKEIKRVGILTSEEQWINENVNIKIKNEIFKIKVIEDPSCSFGLAPKINSQEVDQSSYEGWLDLDTERMEMDEFIEEAENVQNCEAPEDNDDNGSAPMHAQSVESRIGKDCDKEQTSRSGGKGKTASFRALAPAIIGRGAPFVPDLNNSPVSMGFFPFLENDEASEDAFDIREEEELEQAINDEIDRKRRCKRKGGKKHVRGGANREVISEADKQKREGSFSKSHEVDQTIKIGEELGIRFQGSRSLVENAISKEGGIKSRC